MKSTKNIQNRFMFFINSIPPDYGGGYLRAYRMAIRFHKNEQCAGILTLTKEESIRENQTNEKFPRNRIYFLKNKVLSPILSIFHLVSNRTSFEVLYICSSHWFTMPALIVSKLLNKKTVIGITLSNVDSPTATHPNPFINLYYKFKSLQFDICDTIVVNSPRVYQECTAIIRYKNKVQFIPNPVDIEKFKPLNNKDYNIRQLPFQTKKNIILFVGSVNERKGADLIDTFMEELDKHNNDYSLLICGNRYPNTSDEILNNLYKKYNTSTNQRVIFLEEASNISELMQVSDILFFPSRNEGLPNVIIEAMACGLPVVSNTLLGITDYLLPKECLVSDNNIQEYIAKTISILSDDILKRSIIDTNINFIHNNLTNKRIDDIFLKL